jgi:lipoprotein-anchoring transpeptidase ErfK/SrfK
MSNRRLRRAVAAAVLATPVGSIGLAARPAGAAPLLGAVGGSARAGLVGAPLQAAAATRPAFYRETVRYGARDSGPYQISHVYEVQIRLSRSGFYGGPITGYFGTRTLAAVKAFQRAQRLPQTGVVGQATWTRLLTYSRQRSPGWHALPGVCRHAGWHTCYSRSTYELFVLNNGTLVNTWLVRGGARGLETVLGTYPVYWRDIDHRSSLFNNAPMPHAQFFYGGEALHGSATMMDPRIGHSHGCINMYFEDAADLWRLTAAHHNTVTVYGAWR